MDNPEPRAQYLNTVLRLIERTSLRIPRFQRDFVWGESDVIDLLGSIKKGYPIGSVLTWRIEAQDSYFSGFREDAFPSADESLNSFEVILDGAQRLSSLYGCLRNPGANSVYSMYFDLRQQTFVHESSVRRVEDWFVPMDSIFDSRRFLQVQSAVANLDDGESLLPRVLDLYSTFQDYQIPIIALSNTNLEDVVEVFRRVNSSGTALSTVDFVRALTWQSSFDLEETFAFFADRYEGTPLRDVTDEFLIRCLAIAAGISLDARDVLQLEKRSRTAGGLSDEVAAMQSALDNVSDYLRGLNITKLAAVPYEVQRLLLFAVFLYRPDFDRTSLTSWLWESTFSEEYQSKPDSYITRLVQAVRNGDIEQALIVRKPVDAGLFAVRQRRGGSAVTLGFEHLMRRSGIRSLLSGELVGEDGVQVPLFSRADLQRAGIEGPQAATRLANLIYLTPDDAPKWHELRNTNSVGDIIKNNKLVGPDFENVWATQGLVAPFDGDPAEVLHIRSALLLERALDS